MSLPDLNPKSWWQNEYVDFVRELAWTVFVFILIALAALGLQRVIHFLESLEASSVIIKALTFAEYTVLVGDVIYLVFSVMRHIALFAVSCWKQVKGALRSPTPPE